jgi:hypothetical protein
MNHKSTLAAICLAVLIVIGIAYAGPAETHNVTLKAADCPEAVAAQTSATLTQSVIWSSTPIDPRAARGNPKVIVDGNFQTSGATVVVTVGRYHYDGSTYTLLGIKQGTLTASTTQTDAGSGSALRYLATSYLEFDLLGANYYDVRMAAPSSGSATIKHYSGCSVTGTGE